MAGTTGTPIMLVFPEAVVVNQNIQGILDQNQIEIIQGTTDQATSSILEFIQMSEEERK
jgi:hypothetical protein